MKLSIITINWNNADGLEKTIQSVVSQTYKEFEYVIVDGASTDGSVDIIKRYAEKNPINWVSEPDKGIYNAMNKGIMRASGEYLHFLNSGDMLNDDKVVEKMIDQLAANNYPEILIGHLFKLMPDGTKSRSTTSTRFSFFRFYLNSINHPSTYIKKELFDKYGLYDESLKIVSDWKWFMQVIAFNGVKPVITDVDVAVFDMNGISVTNSSLRHAERRKVLTEEVPQCYLSDYDRFWNDIIIMQRIRRHPMAFKIVRFIERCLFKLEKAKKK